MESTAAPSNPSSACFTIRRVSKTYRTNGTQALKEFSAVLPWGARIGVLGHSGAGKSTLLHVLGLLDKPDPTTDAGVELLFHGSETQALSYFQRTGPGVAPLTEAEQDRLKKQLFGFVFQRGHLLHHLTAEENVALKPMLDGRDRAERIARAGELLRYLGLNQRSGHRTHELSGGEAQRVAVLRALASSPRVVFADEPTGNLDRKNAADVLALLSAWQQGGTPESPRTLLLVTHQVQDAWDHCTHFLIVHSDGTPPELLSRVDLENTGGLPTLTARLTETTQVTQRETMPTGSSHDRTGRLKGWDYARLAWGDLTRREHLPTTFANGLVLFFLLLLSFVGLALSAGMNTLVQDRFQALEATTFSIDALKTRDGYFTDALTAKLEQMTLDSGKPAFPPELGGVQRFNLPSKQFYLHGKDDDQHGPLADRPVGGRTALPQDPDLLALLPGGFSSLQAREIIVTRQFLTDEVKAPETARVVWLDVSGQAMKLRVVKVVDRIRGGAAYILPDGFVQLLQSPLFNPQPLAKGFALGGLADPAGIVAKMKGDADIQQRLTEGNLEVQAEKDRLIVRLAGGQTQRQDVIQRLGNFWRRLLAQRGWLEVKATTLEDLPAPDLELPAPSFSMATLRVRHTDDLREVDGKLKEYGLAVPGDVMGVLDLLRNTVEPLSWMIFGIVVLALLVGVGNLAVTMAQMVREKRVEIGILKAHGMTTGQLGWLFALEGSLLVLGAVLLARLAALGLSALLNRTAEAAGWPPLIAYDALGLWVTIGVAAVLGPTVCWLATWRQASVTPAEAVA